MASTRLLIRGPVANHRPLVVSERPGDFHVRFNVTADTRDSKGDTPASRLLTSRRRRENGSQSSKELLGVVGTSGPEKKNPVYRVRVEKLESSGVHVT